jgi:hypothetical protein
MNNKIKHNLYKEIYMRFIKVLNINKIIHDFPKLYL